MLEWIDVLAQDCECERLGQGPGAKISVQIEKVQMLIEAAEELEIQRARLDFIVETEAEIVQDGVLWAVDFNSGGKRLSYFHEDPYRAIDIAREGHRPCYDREWFQSTFEE